MQLTAGRLLLVWAACLALIAAGSRGESAPACGGLLQPPCDVCTMSVTVYWPFNFCCIPMATQCIEWQSQCNAGYRGGRDAVCYPAGWKAKALDTSRGSACNNGVSCGAMNCWQCDDQVRDRLDMDWTHLNFVTELRAGTAASALQDGRYVYVFRGTDDRLLVRRYDRDDRCRDYRAYRFSGNVRSGGYLHVRHSQLNGGWTPVWAAGEMRIKDGKIYRVNNESGHFKPAPDSVQYVVDVLNAWRVPLHGGFRSGDFAQVTASECVDATGAHGGPTAAGRGPAPSVAGHAGR